MGPAAQRSVRRVFFDLGHATEEWEFGIMN